LEQQKSRAGRIGAQGHVHENASDTRVRDQFAGDEEVGRLHVSGVQEAPEEGVDVRVRAVPEIVAEHVRHALGNERRSSTLRHQIACEQDDDDEDTVAAVARHFLLLFSFCIG